MPGWTPSRLQAEVAAAREQGANTTITEGGTEALTYAFALGYGGLAQLLAGMWCVPFTTPLLAQAPSCLCSAPVY